MIRQCIYVTNSYLKFGTKIVHCYLGTPGAEYSLNPLLTSGKKTITGQFGSSGSSIYNTITVHFGSSGS